MNRRTEVFVLTRLVVNSEGQVISKNVGVTFDTFLAEAHRAGAVENDFERYPIAVDWLDHAEQSNVVSIMRGFRQLVEEMQQASLR